MGRSSKLTPLQLARDHYKRGFTVVPVIGKKPCQNGWQRLRISPSDQPEVFKGRCTGVAVHLGASGIVDLEADCAASALALQALAPPTGCITRSPSGREHYFYNCPNGKTKKYSISPRVGGHQTMLVELRAGNSLSVLPGSAHPDYSVPYTWVNNNEPSQGNLEELQRTALLAAVAGAVAEHYPAKGTRHTFAQAVAGFLRRAEVAHHEAAIILQAALLSAGDDEVADRLKAVETTYRRHENEPITGLPTIETICGKALADWLSANLLKHRVGTVEDEHASELVQCTETDIGNAQRFVRRHGQNFRYCKLWDTWLYWNERVWECDIRGIRFLCAKDTMQRIILEAFLIEDRATRERRLQWSGKSSNATRIREMLWVAQSDIPAMPDDFDIDPWQLNCLNGTINLRTGELLSHRREDLITKLCPITYDCGASCPTWEKFLLRIMNRRRHMVEYLQRVIGFILTGIPADRVMFFLFGSGRNGKSTFIETLHSLFGTYSKKTSADTLLLKPTGDSATNDLAELKGARLVTSAELPEGRRLNEARIKDLTGRDTIKARFLYKEFFEFRSQFKLLMYGNHKPVIRGTDAGIWDRVKLIPFDVRISDSQIDSALPDKLLDELPGILAWAVRGCLEWQRIGFAHPNEVTTATEAYRQEQNPLQDFLTDCCLVSVNAKIENVVLWRAYESWCDRNGERYPLGRKQFSQRLFEHGFRQKIHGNRYWEGIKLAEHTPPRPKPGTRAR